MKRAIEAVLTAAVAVAFVACVEFVLMMWRRRRRHVEKVAVVVPAQLQVRRATDGVRATFAVDGVLDAFSARLLACAVAQTPPAATVVLDLSVAGPIQDNLAGILANACASRRRVQLRGLNEVHAGLLERLRGRGVATAVIEEKRDDAREAA
jgi:hypothetical protein